MTHTVRANEGFVSGPMFEREALRYARRLRKLGNVKVWVCPIKGV